MRKRGFTLTETVVVVVLIGILAAIAGARYVVTVEKGRTVEAKNVLGRIRSAETAYYLYYDTYTTSLSYLAVDAPTFCNTTFYFNYSITGGGASYTATASRCTSGGKIPNAISGSNYSLNMTQDGILGGPAPYV